MAGLTVEDGAQITKDPETIRIYGWNWDRYLEDAVTVVQSSWLVLPVRPKSAGATPLTVDNAALQVGSRATQIRVLGGTKGHVYKLTNRVIPSSIPAESFDASITILIADK
jgi:hypothetical protein